MKKQDWKKTKTIYWSDEAHDDFNEVGLSRPSLPEDFKYERDNHFVNFFTKILYFGLAVPILGLATIFNGIKVKGRKNLKKVKKQGIFIYSNHVSVSDAFKIQTRIFPFKMTNILGYSDALSMPFFKHLVKGLGLIALPTKGDIKNMKKFTECFDYFIKKKQNIIIYPEAHIWPYYTKIRNFREGSFLYPSLSAAPIVPIVTVFRKSKISKKAKQTLLIGEPIFPKEELTVMENKKYLHDECLKAMQLLSSSVKQYEYIKYIKKENNN